MPEGSGRKVIAAQAGGAFWAGGLVAASADRRTKLRARPIPTASMLLIVEFLISSNNLLIAPATARQ
jgi:hypothetical protein